MYIHAARFQLLEPTSINLCYYLFLMSSASSSTHQQIDSSLAICSAQSLHPARFDILAALLRTPFISYSSTCMPITPPGQKLISPKKLLLPHGQKLVSVLYSCAVAVCSVALQPTIVLRILLMLDPQTLLFYERSSRASRNVVIQLTIWLQKILQLARHSNAFHALLFRLGMYVPIHILSMPRFHT